MDLVLETVEQFGMGPLCPVNYNVLIRLLCLSMRDEMKSVPKWNPLPLFYPLEA